MPTASAVRGPTSLLAGVRDFLGRHRRAVAIAVSGAALIGFVLFVVPQIRGLSGTLSRLRGADPAWIGLALAVETASLGAYGLLFRSVFCCEGVRIDWREAYQITLAGTVATKLLSTAGAGGVALTVWALRASGLRPKLIARRMLAFELLLYGAFALTLVVVGLGLRTGLMEGNAPWTLTVVPAIVGGAAIIVTLALGFVPAAPAALREAIRIAAELVRRRPLAVLGAAGYWGFDIAALWASLHAFGTPPPLATIVMAYFVGQLGNVLPLPGGVGGVEGGMIAALIAFGSPGALAILGVLAYRLISFWLPTAPGAVAYLRLRRTVGRWRDAHGVADDAASAEPEEGDVTLGVRHHRAVRDVANLAAGHPAADADGHGAPFRGDEQIAGAHTRALQRRVTQP
ncbi:MAG: YbhN family protein [Solirubrobacteraceae bacterium]